MKYHKKAQCLQLRSASVMKKKFLFNVMCVYKPPQIFIFYSGCPTFSKTLVGTTYCSKMTNPFQRTGLFFCKYTEEIHARF